MGPPASSNNLDNNNDDDDGGGGGGGETRNKNQNNVATRSLKKTTDSDLKSSVIEFMKARPFLWNRRHSGYKDHKKRDREFMEFSNKIGFSVQEIKRVWHVLRTNFFRAHKILSDKPNGTIGANLNGTEKVWKYYTAMLYILEGSNLEPTTARTIATISRASNSSMPASDRSIHATSRRVSNRLAASSSPMVKDTNGLESVGRMLIASNGTSIASASTSSTNTPAKVSTFNESLLDEDDDFLYARSLSLTLRKFDPTTKEVVKLKFQEIIVDYMQKLQQQQQQQQMLLQQQHQQSQQLSKLEPPPPSEIANMEASLAANKKDISTNEVT